LSGYGSVTATGRANLSGRKHEVDVRENVIDTVRVMFDSACMHDHRGLRAAIESSSFDNAVCGHTADLRRDIRRVAHREVAGRLPVVRAGSDEILIDEVLGDQYM